MDNLLMDNLMPSTGNYPSSFIEPLRTPELSDQHLQADVLRLDKLHPVISGNKWFKLKGYLQTASQSPHNSILTFGGPWSNHIIATAYATRQLKIPSIGVIRGEKPATLSTTLQTAAAYGMQLEYISRQQYKEKDDPNFLSELTHRFPGVYIIPEGGAGPAGIQGSRDILKDIRLTDYTHICCAIGTGTMYTGLLQAALPHQTLVGIPVLKGFYSTWPDDRSLILPHYHFGGYGHHPSELLDFINSFYRDTRIPLDIVYTSKLFFGILDQARQHLFPANSRLLIVHSGGLQGNGSLPAGSLAF